jgi:polyhydroxybutyrate depolymerase
VHFAIGVPVPQWAGTWALRNDCRSDSTQAEAGAPVTIRRWTDCRAGADVSLYTILGGGHGWPQALDAAAVLWDFFRLHPRPAGGTQSPATSG